MKKNNKKGFTIVELVIVIAVIAILAAVLIPTFSSVIKKAKVNNDIQLVRNLNTALATANKKHKTMQSALDSAAEFGYDVAKINASATDNEILWDSKNDVFCYLKDGKIEYIPNSVADDDKLSVNSYLLWKISDTVDPTYSTYYTGKATTFIGDNAITKGFDAGTTTGITEINYRNEVSAQDVVIRTNSLDTVVTVTAFESGTFGSDDYKCDSIRHFGDAKEVNIIKAGKASYHEFGNVGFTQVASGRFVAEAGSKTNTVVATTVNAVIDINGGEIEHKYATDDSYGGANSKGNVELEVIDPSDVEQIKTGATLFAGGKGTKNNPFLIKTTEHIQNISELYQNLYIVENDKNIDYSAYAAYKYADTNIYIFEQPSTKGFYYKVADGVTQLDCSNWTPVDLYGSFDGNNCKFINLDQTFFSKALNYYNYETKESELCEISNCDFDVKVLKTASAAPIVFSAGPKVKFTNVNVSGRVEGQYISSFVGFGVGQFAWKNASYNPAISADYEFVNCHSTATLTCVSIGEGAAAGFFAHIYSGTDSTVRLTNSTYEGRMNVFVKTSNGFYINCMGSATITMDEVSASKLKSGTTNQYAEANVQIIAGNKNGTVSRYNAITENAVENASYAIATYMIGTNPGGIQGAYITERIELEGNTFTSVKAHRYDVVIDKTDSYFYKIDGNTIKLGRPNCTGINTNYIIFNQYDSSGNLLSSVMYAFGSTSTIQE